MQPWLIPDDLLYDHSNMWVRLEGSEARVGLSQYGQFTTGDILFLDLLPGGSAVKYGQSLGSIESGKWVGRLVSPLSGTILKVNQEVEENPGLVNRDPYGQGWLIRVQIQDASEVARLMDASSYLKWVLEQERREEEERKAI